MTRRALTMLVLLLASCLAHLGSGCVSRFRAVGAPLRPADAIVVLGNRPPVDEQGNVRPELRRRVETGVRLYQSGLAPILVMTGGPSPSGHVEAEVMRDLAIELGVPAHNIRVEGASRDTIENAGFSVRLVCTLEMQLCIPELIVVSSPFHLHRAQKLFECAGARTQIAPTPVPDDPNYARSFAFYETLVRAYYGFIDACGRARQARHTTNGGR